MARSRPRRWRAVAPTTPIKAGMGVTRVRVRGNHMSGRGDDSPLGAPFSPPHDIDGIGVYLYPNIAGVVVSDNGISQFRYAFYVKGPGVQATGNQSSQCRYAAY